MIRRTHGFRNVAATLGLAALASPALAQSDNVTLRSTFSPSSVSYSDIWGYAAGGVELAILTAEDGTYFVDVTDPSAPSQVAFLPGVLSSWRDAKTYDQYAYIVTEGGGGLQIVSLANPLLPTPVGAAVTEFDTAHNVWIDEELGLLFAVGCDNLTSTETNVYDLAGTYEINATPTTPAHIFTFSDYYIHDMYSQDGIAYMAAINNGDLRTVDLSLLPSSMPTLDTITTDGSFTHNVWTTTDGTYAFATDEISGGHVTILDVSDPNDVFRVGKYTHPTDPTTIIHNVAVRGDFLYVSWYRAGLEVIDVTIPTAPVRLGFYDTSPLAGNGFNGAWGIYPYAPSGAIYVSDIEGGLFVLELDDTFGFAEGTVTDQSSGDPIEAVSVSADGTGVSGQTTGTGFYHLLLETGSYDLAFESFLHEGASVVVSVSNGSTTTTDVQLVRKPSGVLSGTVYDGTTLDPIEGASVTVLGSPLVVTSDAGGAYGFDPIPEAAYTVEADAFGYAPRTVDTSVTAGQTTNLTLTLTPAIAADDMESPTAWSVGGGAATGAWIRVDPIGTAAQPEDDHTPDPGVMCWVTGQGPPGGAVGDNDVDGGQTTLSSPIYDLSGFDDATIEYYRWFVNDAGDNPGEDPFVVDVSVNGGASWANAETFLDSRAFWERVRVSLSDLALTPTDQVQIRFIAVDAGGGSIVEAGIDDLELFGVSTLGTGNGAPIRTTRLHPLAPNPFRTGTVVHFELATRGEVTLDVFDVQGRLVVQLAGGTMDAGVRGVYWDGTTRSGTLAAPGVYHVRLRTESQVTARKVVRAR